MPTQIDDSLTQLSQALASRVAAAAPLVAAIGIGQRRPLAGIVWRAGVVVTSEQALPEAESFPVSVAGAAVQATFAGRDPRTNVAVLKFEAGAAPPGWTAAALPLPGSLALVLGAGLLGAGPDARMAMVRRVGAEWHSMAGGRIDHLLRLDLLLANGADGGPVLDASGALLGMATSGPRKQALVIPHQTIARVLEPLLARGRVPRAWLGLGLQPVSIPETLREAAGQKRGLMVVALANDGPAGPAGILPGDILLTLDGVAAGRPTGLSSMLAAEHIGRLVDARIIRAGNLLVVPIRLTERP
jgi:S1-C subfamily serine protease